MMAEHGNPCDPKYADFCMNGGTCYEIPSMDTRSCHCSENYGGERCQNYQLPSYSFDDQNKGLLAGIGILVLLILAVLIVVIYYLNRTLKDRKPKQQDHATGIGRGRKPLV